MHNRLSIYELRLIARNIGVKCPTKLKKDELVEQIGKIESGEIPPYFTKKGRPSMTGYYNKTEQNIRNKIKILYDFAKNLAEEFGVN